MKRQMQPKHMITIKEKCELIYGWKHFVGLVLLWDIFLRSLKTHFVDGSLQEVMQQVTSFSQGAGTDHHRGIH